MSEQDPFAPQDDFQQDDFQQAGPPKKEGMSGCAIAAIGCGVVALLILILGGITAFWVAQNARELGADFASTALKQGIRELDLPANQVTRINARIDDVAQQFKDEKLTLEEVGSIFQQIAEGPLMPAGLALVAKRMYVRDSGLSEDEKAAAELSLHRFARGSIDQTIPEAERDAVLDLISTKDAQGNRQFEQALTDDEVRGFVAAAKKAADDAGVPEKVPEINFADEFDKAIDEALGQPGGAALDAIDTDVMIEVDEESTEETTTETETTETETTETETTEAETAAVE
ncbi:MAG: hypothetical protein ACYTGL_20950 [Planctomycetota bacterium]|jgi:hypothetical protein